MNLQRRIISVKININQFSSVDSSRELRDFMVRLAFSLRSV